MACSVFGNPVTDEIVRKHHPNLTNNMVRKMNHPNLSTKITVKHRAEVALQFMNLEETVMEVKRCIQNLMANLNLPITATIGVIFNATGNDITFELKHTWEGQALKPCPQIIQNGQWGVFLHVGLFGPSKEAVVYSASNSDETPCDWMFAWHTTKGDCQNHVYTEIREIGHYETVDWNCIGRMLEKQKNSHCDNWNGCVANISVGKGNCPLLTAILTLDGLPPNCMAMARDVSVASKLLN